MNRLGSVVATAITALTLAACTAAAVPTPVPLPTAANAVAPTLGSRMGGTVQSVSGNTITLGDGASFTLGSETRVTHQIDLKVTDLQPGDLVAVTAKKQDDGTLLATIVNVFPTSLRANITQLQRPIPNSTDLMTNATVDQVSADGFSVTYPNGSAQVKLAPGARLSKQGDGTPADIKVGSVVTGLVNNGVARTVSVR